LPHDLPMPAMTEFSPAGLRCLRQRLSTRLSARHGRRRAPDLRQPRMRCPPRRTAMRPLRLPRAGRWHRDGDRHRLRRAWRSPS